MSADRLREAARVLRGRAEACDPWEGDDDHGSWAVEYRTDGGNGTDAALIRVMHPGVALALADWLDIEANRNPEQPIEDGLTVGGPVLQAIAVADAILGGAS